MKGQITIFVIIALLIVSGIGLTLYLTRTAEIPSKIMPVEDKVAECISDSVNEGTDILGEQAGYIEMPEFEPGSSYAPFGSQFDFFGSTMPYWFYKSGNGIYKEQMPTLAGMAGELENYVNENIKNCDLSGFEENYVIETSNETSSRIIISENQISAEVEWPVTVTLGDTKQRITTHKATVNSNFGSMYTSARKIYEDEKNKLFLEDYAVDVLFLYAPGTDVEISCAPKIWSKQKVTDDIKNALEANIQTIKFSGDYYDLRNDKYFVHDLGEKIKNQVNVIYNPKFPMNLEVLPSDGDLMKADPVGIQEGLGILGFCYVPYHFVYSASFPVVIQVFDEDYKMFQFPMTVEIENNLPRGAAKAEEPGQIVAEICQYKPQEATISTISEDGEPVEADIQFKCSSTICNIGKTEIKGGEAVLNAGFPQCANGFAIAKAEGYAVSKVQFSTNEAESAEIIMRPVYKLDLKVFQGEEELKDETALISFKSKENVENVLFPNVKTVELSENLYDVNVYIFKTGEITLPPQTSTQCVNAPASGVLGMLGFEKKECFDLNIPEQTVTQLIAGGGSAEWIASLKGKDSISIYVPGQKIPATLDELQEAYSIIESNSLEII